MTVRPETWWDDRLPDTKTFEFFIENLGGINMPSRVAAREIALAKGIKSVVDVGCGPALDRWTDTGIAWTGAEPSKFLVDYCHQRHISVDEAPAHLLPYQKQSFDLVYSRHVWEHLPHYKFALAEACRVAKVGVMITFFRPPGSVERANVIDGAFYNDYNLLDMKLEFSRHWPGCRFEEKKLAPQKYLPQGEVILCVWK